MTHVPHLMTPMSPSAGTVTGSGRTRTYLLAGGAYLVASVVLWWHVLPHPGTVTTCGCGDAALTLWVVKWPAYALSHGLNPFYSSKLFVPRGINMAPNSLGLGVATAPVTWLFGPVASLNLIDLVSPPLSALAMFWLLRRWVDWSPAAFVGGLVFGFSPFVLTSLALAHPNFGLLAPVPLIIGCVDDLVVRHRHRPVRVGITLGVLVAVEFFISVEVLLLTALFAGFALVAAAVWVAVRRPAGARETVLGALPALGAAAGVSIVLLAYPLWFFFAGPAHLVGRAWPDSPAGTVTNAPADFVNGFVSTPLTAIMHLFGGYQGPRLPLLCYLGVGMLAVLLVGCVLWRREPLIRWFGLLGLVAAVLSLGVHDHIWTPWRLATHLPVLDNVVPVNITAVIDTCVAVVLAVIVQRSRDALRPRSDATGTAAALAVGALALVPIAVAFWPNLPMTVRPVQSPRWFATVAHRLPDGTVVLPYPAALGGIQSSMAWQAVEGMTFSMVGGGGPGITRSRAGPETPGYTVLGRASIPLGPPPRPTPDNLAAIRRALVGWGVTTIVVPDQPGLPTYDRGRSVPYAVGLLTAATGRAPFHQARAWVWSWSGSGGAGAATARPAIPLTPARFDACVGLGGTPAGAGATAACVLGSR